MASILPCMTEARGSGVFAVSKTRRVLIVDDHVDSAELLAEVLSAQGHETRVAHEADEAERIALEFSPQVAILDLRMPLTTGYELALRLRAHERLAECRLLALTGLTERADRALSEASGFEAHLTKPFDLRAVLAAVAAPPGAPRVRATAR